MGKYAYLQGSGSSPQVGARMSSYAWLGVVLAVRAGRVDHPASPPRPLNTAHWVTASAVGEEWLAESLRRRAARREARAIAPLIITRPAAAILVRAAGAAGPRRAAAARSRRVLRIRSRATAVLVARIRSPAPASYSLK